MTYRAKDNHPTSIKLREIEALMDKLNVTFEIGAYGKIQIMDNEDYENISTPVEGYLYVDAENNEPATHIPYSFENKLIYVKD